MKSKYVVLCEGDYDGANGHSSYAKVKTFRNEPEALLFVSDSKNLRLYGELFRERRDSDGSRYEWDNVRQEWTPLHLNELIN